MKKLITLIMVLSAFLCPAVVMAEGELTVTSKNAIIKIGEDSGIFVARVENTGDAPIYYDNGKMVIFSDKDDILASANYVYSSPSDILLQPGEYTYCYDFLWNSELKNAKLGDVKFSVSSDTSGNSYNQLPATAELELPGTDFWSYNYVNVTFTNTTEEVLYGAYLVAAITDVEGNLIYVDRSDYDNIGIHPGSTVTIKMFIDSDYITYYETNNIKPANVEALVYYNGS